jgi:hypothetical protein
VTPARENDLFLLGLRNDGLTRSHRRCKPLFIGTNVSRIATSLANYPGGPNSLDAVSHAVSAQPYTSNGHAPYKRVAPKTNLRGQSSETGSSRDRVTSAHKQRPALDSSHRPNHVPPFVGGFPGTEPVVDRAVAVSDLAARPGPSMQRQKRGPLSLFLS